MAETTLIIGGIEIPIYALTDQFSQEYERIGGFSLRRKLNGAGLLQSQWSKLRTTISGGGGVPAPLAGLVIGTAYEVECAKNDAIASVSNVINLPAGRRSGGQYAPVGYAAVGGLLVSTPLVLVADEATMTVVSGAQHYEVHYWPRFTGYVTRKHGGEPWRGRNTWSLTIEEA